MSRRRGLISSIAAMQRAAEQASRTQARAAREIERLQKQRERERLANEKEQLNLFHEHHEEEAESRNRDLAEAIRQVSNLLNEAVGPDHRLKFERLKAPLKRPEFNPGLLSQAEEPPKPENYRPKPPGSFARLIPGVKARHQLAIREARIRFDGDVAAHGERDKSRQLALHAARKEHEERVRQLEEKIARQHAQIDALESEYAGGRKEAVRQYCEAVLSSQPNPDGWPHSFKIAFVPESKQVVVEYDFPGFDIISEIAAHKYVRSKKEITTTHRSETERKRLYFTMIAQATLRVVHVLFNADYAGHVESIVFNGHVDAIDQATGHQVHPCIVTLRTTRSVFSQLDLTRVNAETCLKGLNASVSKRPTELAPVKPVLDFNMVDPRFVHEEEILSGLDNRSNLMDLNPDIGE